MEWIIRNTIIMAGVLLFMNSCSDNFLTPEPKSFFAPENVYTDQAGFEALLVTMQRDLVWEHNQQSGPIMNQYGKSEAGIPGRSLNYTADMRPTSDKYASWINDMYEFIKNANVVISRIDDIEWDDQQARNEILAEALWHRSYWYYRMVHTWGDVPFVGEEVQSAKLDFKTHTREAILEKLQEDMEYSVEHIKISGDPGQPTLGAANHLLAKIALANRNWDKAIDAATDVIDGPYALMEQRFGQDADDPNRNVLWDLHRHMNKNLPENTETLLATVDRYDAPSAARRGNGTWSMRDYHPSWWASWNGKDSEGNSGMIDSGPMYDSLGRGNPNIRLSEWLGFRIWEEFGFDRGNTPDLRRADINWMDREEYFYNNPESVDFGKPFDINNMDRPGHYWTDIFATPYYKTYAPSHPDRSGWFHGGHGDMYIFRLAETYLLRAEAHYWKGVDMQAAASDINAVRGRANATLISAGDVTIDYIFDERMRELVIETPRQNEMVRVSFILAAENINGYSLESIHTNNWWHKRVMENNDFFFKPMEPAFATVSVEPFHFLWPIDDDLINENTLGVINQNQGYTGAERNEAPLESITIGDGED